MYLKISKMSIIIILIFSIIFSNLALISSSESRGSQAGKIEIVGNGSILFYYPGSFITHLITADLDNDGDLEIILGKNECELIVLSDSGELLWKIAISAEFNEILVGNFESTDYKNICLICEDLKFRMITPEGDIYWTKDAVTGASYHSIGDLDGDYLDEFVIFSHFESQGGIVRAWDGDGELLWTYTTDKFPGNDESILISDIDNDGMGEVIVGTWVMEDTDSLIALESNGDFKWSTFLLHPGIVGNVSAGIHNIKTLDFDQDGQLEIAVGGDWCLALLDNNGKIIWKEDAIICDSICTGDFDGDNKTEMAVVGSAAIYKELHIFNQSGIFRSFPVEKNSKYIFPFDLEQDGIDEMVVGTISHSGEDSDNPEHSLLTYNYSGGMVWGLKNSTDPIVIEDLTTHYGDEILVCSESENPGLYIIDPRFYRSYPNFEITLFDIENNDSNIENGQVVRFIILIENIGDYESNAILEVFLDNQSLVTEILPIIELISVMPFYFNWTATEGNHTIKATVDPLNVIAELNENNNDASIDLTIGPKKEENDDGDNDFWNDDTDDEVTGESVLFTIMYLLGIFALIIIIFIVVSIKIQRQKKD